MFEFIILVGLIVLIVYSKKQERKENLKNSRNINGDFCCPYCKSTNVVSNKRGITLSTGLIGTQKVCNTCLSCGKKWYI